MAQEDGYYFIEKMDECLERLIHLSAKATRELARSDNQVLHGILRVARGQTYFFIKKKAKRFRELCYMNTIQREGEQFPTNNDLATFWDQIVTEDKEIRKYYKCLNEHIKKLKEQLEVGTPNHCSESGIANSPQIPFMRTNQSSIRQRNLVVSPAVTDTDHQQNDEEQIFRASSSNGSHKTRAEQLIDVGTSTRCSECGITNSPQIPFKRKSKWISYYTYRIPISKKNLVLCSPITEAEQQPTDQRHIQVPSSSKRNHNIKEKLFEICQLVKQDDSECEENARISNITCQNKLELKDASTQRTESDEHLVSCSARGSDAQESTISDAEVQPLSNEEATVQEMKHTHSKYKVKSHEKRHLNKSHRSQEKNESRHCEEEVDTTQLTEQERFRNEKLCSHCMEDVFRIKIPNNKQLQSETATVQEIKHDHAKNKNKNHSKQHLKKSHRSQETHYESRHCEEQVDQNRRTKNCKIPNRLTKYGNTKRLTASREFCRNLVTEEDSWLFNLSKRMSKLLPFCKPN